MSIRLKTIQIRKNSPSAERTRKLYEEAFPKIERIGFELLEKCAKGSGADFFAYYDGDAYVGFAFVLLPGDYAYLLFCATEPELRSRGYGAAIIRKLRRRYPERSLVLDIEPLSEMAGNSLERSRRYLFYVNNGFTDTGYEMRDRTGVFRILSECGTFDSDGFLESYRILPEIFEGTEIWRDGCDRPVFVPEADG